MTEWVRTLCPWLGLGTMLLVGTVPAADSVPMVVFGPQALPAKGDHDSRERVLIRVPKSVTGRLYLQILDPDLGDGLDEPTGGWNGRTRFSLHGADGPLLERVFGRDSATDGQWYSLGGFMADQGLEEVDSYRFELLIRGMSGDDGNLFKVAVGYDPRDHESLPGIELSGDVPSIGLVPEPGRVAEARFAIPASTSALRIKTFDLDGARAELHVPFLDPRPLTSSGDGDWGEDLMKLAPSVEDRTGALVINAGRSLLNNLALEVRDQDGRLLPVELPVRSYSRGTPPRPMFEHRIDSDCLTLHLDAGGSRDAEDRLVQYRWGFGDGSAAEGEQVQHRYSAPGTYRVVLTLVDDSGRVLDRARRSESVKINQPPRAVPEAPSLVAPGQRIGLDGSGSVDPDGRITDYRWDLVDGTRASGARVSKVYREPGLYRIQLRVEDDGPGPCRDATGSTEIRVNAPPVAVAGDDRSAAVGEALVFDAGASRDPDGELTRFLWDLGDGTRLEGQSVEHAYRAPGRYRVSLRVEDDAHVANSSADDGLLVRVNAPPQASIRAPARGAAGEELTFDGSGSRDRDGGLLEHRWDFGDGHWATGERVTHAYGEPGAYRVTLTVRDDSGTDSELSGVETQVVINRPPAADAGEDQWVTASEVHFDGTGSRDPDGEIGSWHWDFGDGATGEGPAPSHVYAAPGTYRVTLRVTDDSGTASAEASDALQLVVNARPVADAGPDRIAAPGQTLVFDGSGSFDPDGELGRLRWDFGDGATAEGQRVEHAYRAPGRYQVRLQVWDQSGHPRAMGLDQALVRVNARPVAAAGADRLAAPGESIDLDGSGSHDPDGEIVAYRWTTDAGRRLSATPRVRVAFDEPGVRVLELEVTDGSGARNASQRDGLAVRVNQRPSAVPGGAVETCNPGVELDGSASWDPDGDQLAFEWDLGDGTGSVPGARISHRFPGPGRYPVLLRVHDGTGLENARHEASTEVRIHSPPIAVADAPKLVCAGEPVLFNGTDSRDPDGGHLLFHWDFGDGTGSNIPTPVKAYGVPGSYSVQLRVEDDSAVPCNSGLDRTSVTVVEAPVADAGADRQVCAHAPVVFDGSGSGDFDGVVNGWSWDFGDGTEGGGPTSTHVYTRAGDYLVTLTVTGDRVGDCSASNSDQARVQVREAPRVQIQGPPLAAPGENLIFEAQGTSSDSLDYQWVFGDGGGAKGPRVEHAYQAPGRYQVVLTAGRPDGGECDQVRVEHAVRVNAPPIAVAGEDQLVATGEPVVLDGSQSFDSDGAVRRFLWDLGDGAQAEGVRVQHHYLSPGTYRVGLRVTDDRGHVGGGDAALATIRVNAAPVPELVIAPLAPCAGEELLLDAGGSRDSDGQALHWSWELEDGIPAEGSTVRHTYGKAGKYLVNLAVTDDAGASNSLARLLREVRVNTPPVPVPDFDRLACPGETLRFDGTRSQDTDGDILAYRWTFGDGAGSTDAVATHAYQGPGRFTATLTVTDDSGSVCASARETRDIRINAAPEASIQVAPGPHWTGGAHDELTFDAAASLDPDQDPLTYHWDFGDGTQGRGASFIHGYSKPGRYRISLQVRDGTGTECGIGHAQADIEVRRRESTQ